MDLKRRLLERHPKSRLTPLPSASAATLRSTLPGIPEDYLLFLTDVGYGSIGDSRFSVYSGPVEPGNIYDDETAEALAGVLLIGDDFAGYCIGYDTRAGWTFGAATEDGAFKPMTANHSFTEFIEDWFLKVE